MPATLTHGDGPHHVLVLHGWFGDASSWRPWLRFLDTSEFTYAFMDYRGYGKRRGEAGEHTMEEIAADARSLADELGWERYSIIGHSMGGKAMQRVLADDSGPVQRMVGISPVTPSDAGLEGEMWDLFAGAADEPGNRRAIIDFTTGNRLTATWLDAMVEYSLATSDRDAFAGYLQAWARTDFHEEIAGNEVPFKVIVGAHDGAIGEEAMRQTIVQWYPNAELEVLPSAGHYAMDETPIELATSIEAFLRG